MYIHVASVPNVGIKDLNLTPTACFHFDDMVSNKDNVLKESVDPLRNEETVLLKRTKKIVGMDFRRRLTSFLPRLPNHPCQMEEGRNCVKERKGHEGARGKAKSGN